MRVYQVTSAPFSPEGETANAPASGDDDGDRVSITDVHGTVARFEMSYSAPSGARTKFGPPLGERVPSAAYLLGALLLGAAVLYAYSFAPSSSRLFTWVVEGDRERPISANILATIVVVSAIGTVARTHMRGVLVSDDWVEARYLLTLGIPRARRWGWPQILRLVVDESTVAFELWDGTFERLPKVAQGQKLVDLLRQHAEHRRIDVTILRPIGRSVRT
jgi:hypothetical protein